MKELVFSMMLWIHNVTGYTMPEPPEISLVSKETMLFYAYGCDLEPVPEENIELCNTRKDWNLNENGPLGMYDSIKKEILSLEKKYLFLNSKDSPSTNVGFKPSKPLMEHIV